MALKGQDKDEKRDSYKIFKKYLRKMESITNKNDWFEFISSNMRTIEAIYGKDSTRYVNHERLLKVSNEKDLKKKSL